MKALIDTIWQRFFHRKNSVENNLRIWSRWDWSRQGEEWSNDPAWKQSLVDNVLYRYMGGRDVILEIGPGGGRWTEYLAGIAKRLVLVDITPVCIQICQERFSNLGNIEYHVNHGTDLGFLEQGTIDSIWSWDVFVHISKDDIRNYLFEVKRLLKPDGIAVIHHSKNGISKTGWRSDMTAEQMIAFSEEAGLVVESQFESWGDDKYRIWPNLPPEKSPDTVSVIRNPSR